MLKNHLKIALRSLGRHRGYAFVNIAGLAVGLAACLLILLYVRDELRYDSFHEEADRIYRVVFNGQLPDAPPDLFAVTSRPVGPALREGYPEVEHVVRLNEWNPVVRHERQYYFDDAAFFAEPSFFEVFTFPLVQGNPATALAEPYSLVLTEAAARKYFGTSDALGRSLTLNDTLTFRVTGVAADVPVHSHVTFDLLTSWATFDQLQPPVADDWLSLNSYTYVLLREGASAAAFERKIAGLITRNFGEVVAQIGLEAELALQPLSRIYLYSRRGSEIGPTSDVRYLYVFSAIALFTLLIACINFMNLATARSVDRAREVGVRKTVGSGRGALVRQFLTEAVLLAYLALLLALVLALAALPFFNDLASKAVPATALFEPGLVFVLLGLVLGVGLLAGSYPALVLSRFDPIVVLKGSFRASGHGRRLRQGLVVFQFTMSVILMVGTLVVVQQLRFMKNQHLGFDKEQVVVVDASGLPGATMQQQYRTAKEAFRQHAAVEQVSATNQVPGRGNWVQILFPEGLPEGESRRARVIPADHDYFRTMGIEVVAGRSFSEDFETDEAAVMLNERAVQNFGWSSPEHALGKTLTFGNDQSYTVVGVFHDYHHYSLQQEIEPTVSVILPFAFDYFAVRIGAQEAGRALAHLKAAWTSLFPGYAFGYFFLDEDFDQQYVAEQRLTEIFGAFAALAILIACLGLFGLAAYITVQRTKEIGVRKVLGASMPGIVVLLSKDFLALVGVAVVLAVPLAYLAMERWLGSFAYQVDLGAGVFVLGGVLALGIALLTVSVQAVRAALSDPVESLRYE